MRRLVFFLCWVNKLVSKTGFTAWEANLADSGLHFTSSAPRWSYKETMGRNSFVPSSSSTAQGFSPTSRAGPSATGVAVHVSAPAPAVEAEAIPHATTSTVSATVPHSVNPHSVAVADPPVITTAVPSVPAPAVVEPEAAEVFPATATTVPCIIPDPIAAYSEAVPEPPVTATAAPPAPAPADVQSEFVVDPAVPFIDTPAAAPAPASPVPAPTDVQSETAVPRVPGINIAAPAPEAVDLDAAAVPPVHAPAAPAAVPVPDAAPIYFDFRPESAPEQSAPDAVDPLDIDSEMTDMFTVPKPWVFKHIPSEDDVDDDMGVPNFHKSRHTPIITMTKPAEPYFITDDGLDNDSDSSDESMPDLLDHAIADDLADDVSWLSMDLGTFGATRMQFG